MTEPQTRRVEDQKQRVKKLNSRLDTIQERIAALQSRVNPVMDSLRQLNKENNFSERVSLLYADRS